MMTAELERAARAIVPPVGATGWRATVLGPREHAVVPIIDGRLDGKPVWRGAQRDLYRLMDLLEGRHPASRRARDIPAVSEGNDEPDRALTEAPVADASTPLTDPASRPGRDFAGDDAAGVASPAETCPDRAVGSGTAAVTGVGGVVPPATPTPAPHPAVLTVPAGAPAEPTRPGSHQLPLAVPSG